MHLVFATLSDKDSDGIAERPPIVGHGSNEP